MDIPPQFIDRAIARVSGPASKRVQWLLDFCESNFPETRGEERKQWCLEWGMFTAGPTGVSSGQNQRLNGKVPNPHQVDHAWRDLRRKLRLLGKGNPWVERVDADLCISIKNGELVTKVEYKWFNDALAYSTQTVKALAEVADHVRICQNSICGRLFLRNKRQTYCSTRCRDTVNKRHYRSRLNKFDNPDV